MLNEFIEKFFGRNTQTSRAEVKERLKLVIAHDRCSLNPQMVEQMRAEILEVLSKYVEIDTDDSEFSLENNQRSTALIANLPIRRVKADSEIETG